MKLHVDIRKRLGSFQLDVRFDFAGGIMALLGASGCGKSLTLRCIAGIERPDEGLISLDGRLLFDAEKGIDLPPQQRRVGYLFQNYALFPNMTARQNVEIAVRGSRKKRREAAREKLRVLYLEGLGDKYPRQLSGGQQQRVALARIFASEPDILLLDEPFSALDSYLKWQIEMELADTLTQFGLPALFVSHNRDEVYRLCKEVCVIHEGKSEPPVSADQLFHSPSSLPSALLSGCKNYSRAEKAGPCRVHALDWGCELETACEVPEDIRYIGVRAHFVRPAKEGESNAIPCGVSRVTEELFSTAVMLRPEGAADGEFGRLRMELPKAQWQGLNAPQKLWVRVDGGDILFLK